MPERFLTLRANGQLYALPARQVVEIIRLPPIARVPQAPRGLLGLANLRGNVLPVASLRGLLGAGEAADGATRAIILDGAASVVLVVDAVETLVAVEADRIETRQAELTARPGEHLTGAFAVNGNNTIVKILDIATLISAAFVQQDRARPARTVAETGAAQPEAGKEDDRQMFVSFDIAGQEYAFPLNVVLEILNAPESMTALPASEDLVLGVTPFRDTLLPLLSLRGLLGFAMGATREAREKIVVARVGGAVVGLLADRMRTIFAADSELIEKIPAVLSARAGGEARISGIFRGESGRRLISLLSPEQLFREDVMDRLKAGRGSMGETTDNEVSRSEERQFVVFQLGEDEFGLPIEAVSEVARVPDQITRLPKTPKFLEGVVNLRGDVVPVVDQRRRFDMPPLADQGTRRLVIVNTDRHRAGLIVDSVSQVLRCSADDIEPAPYLTNEAIRLVHGVINLENAGRIVLLLDPTELLTRTERGLLDAFEAKTERARL